jgi:hypothetical protein
MIGGVRRCTIWLEHCSHRDMTQSSVLHYRQRRESFTSRSWPFGFPFIWGFVNDIICREKVQNINELRGRIVKSCRVRYQWNASQYLSRNWISSWCVSCHYGAILRSTEHIRNCLRSSVWICVYLSTILYGWRCMRYSIAMLSSDTCMYICTHTSFSIASRIICYWLFLFATLAFGTDLRLYFSSRRVGEVWVWLFFFFLIFLMPF